MATVQFRVNGSARTVYVLRDDFGLTGTKFGCGLAQCGACTVHVDGRAVRACATAAPSVQGREVTTIEGLGSPERPDPVQAAFIAEQAAQCGYCTTRVVCAQDCGLMINPDSVRSQVEGNILQTLSRTLHEEIVFDWQPVTTLDWASYPILTFPEVPALEIELIQRLGEPPLGVGEAASAPVAAALGNAVFDATGVRLREVPFRPDRVRVALAGGRS